MKKTVALILALAMLLCVMPTSFAFAEDAPTIVRIGTHWTDGEDPLKIDETTGGYTMTNVSGEADRLQRVAALERVKEELNVEIQFVQYAKDTRQELVLSVLAGNPVCDIAMMWGGSENTVLGQNILQPLENYKDAFAEGTDWMLVDAMYGHNFFIKQSVSFYQRWPLVVNLTMLDAVDTLKEEDGTTLYPMELLERGEWTWSTYKDYLQKIQAYYNNTPAPDGAKVSHVMAYETDHRFATLSASYANGGGIYVNSQLSVNKPEMEEAVAFIRELRELGVMCDPDVYDDGFTPQWLEGCYDFGRGATVFTDMADWTIPGQVNARSEAGQSVAIMPWPRPDDMAADDPNYRQVISVSDLWGVLKGVPEDQARLAIKALSLYWKSYYEIKAEQETGTKISSIDDYKAAMATAQANTLGLDILNPDYGDSVLNAFIYNSQNLASDVSDLLGMRVPWDTVLGKGFYGVDGTAAYEVAIEANLSNFTTVVSDMEAILGSTELHDNQAPSVSASGTVTLPLGADIATVDFTQYFTGEDDFDGVLDPAAATYDTSKVDTATVGSYKVKGVFADKAGNEGSAEVTVIVYNAENTTAPTLTVKEELPTIAMDTDTATIDWTTFIETATDADGLDIKASVKADLSNLDAFTPGEYPVALTVTDYAGNTTTVEITVQVVAE